MELHIDSRIFIRDRREHTCPRMRQKFQQGFSRALHMIMKQMFDGAAFSAY